jgi:hypothetical protein
VATKPGIYKLESPPPEKGKRKRGKCKRKRNGERKRKGEVKE